MISRSCNLKKIIFIFSFGLLICQNNEMSNLSKHLEAFEPYIGKTYKGEFAESTPETPVFDVQYWERILNGNGVKITHSVNDGEYAGESIIMWDLKSESLQSWYFTTAGFYTEATVRFEDKKVQSNQPEISLSSVSAEKEALNIEKSLIKN